MLNIELDGKVRSLNLILQIFPLLRLIFLFFSVIVVGMAAFLVPIMRLHSSRLLQLGDFVFIASMGMNGMVATINLMLLVMFKIPRFGIVMIMVNMAAFFSMHMLF